ncbi:hypothetical protein SISNIDRAFT_489375 [Sistotremastrum niveocremeum HHB9708]|uniref:Uncharacterized protein n=1 Tax=Sistotremastrum niveocremeum HHB9708 TaxID=1314777 RepID=A0A164Q8A0_9AGAM|nr:hypothetical protein SISNIDRAFT_489375 [Sistotremastrum niveocremeum HHB9708]
MQQQPQEAPMHDDEVHPKLADAELTLKLYHKGKQYNPYLIRYTKGLALLAESLKVVMSHERARMHWRFANCKRWEADSMHVIASVRAGLHIYVTNILDDPTVFAAFEKDPISSPIIDVLTLARALRYASEVNVENLKLYARGVRDALREHVQDIVIRRHQTDEEDPDAPSPTLSEYGSNISHSSVESFRPEEEPWYEQRCALDEGTFDV